MLIFLFELFAARYAWMLGNARTTEVSSNENEATA